MKWYFALNEASIASDTMYAQCVQAAVLSAMQNTSLFPHLIFDGACCALTKQLERVGVRVIYHRSSLSNAISNCKMDDTSWQQIAHGAFLRIDLPEIEHDSEYVLYTDCDVLFLSEPSFVGLTPRYFAVAPEFTPGDFENMNSGVMLMNIPEMRRVQDDFRAFIRQGLATFEAFDQGALRSFFKGRFDRLPETLNWKPYWGENQAAEILHFHGPKPPHVQAIIEHGPVNWPPILIELYDRDPPAYRHAIERWTSYQKRAAKLWTLG